MKYLESLSSKTSRALEPAWLSPPDRPTLAEKEIHIWRLILDQSSSDTASLKGILSDDERVRAGSFFFKKDRECFVLSHGVLRIILGRYLNEEPKRLKFDYSSKGKPSLIAGSREKLIKFNLAHSNKMVLYAFSEDQELGVDVEYRCSVPEAEEIIGSLFSPYEKEVFRTLPSTQKQEAFFNCWTRKEAYIKAIGEGTTYPLDQFDVSLAPGESARLLKVRRSERESLCWSLLAFIPAPDYVAALAVKSNNFSFSFWELPPRLQARQ